MHNRYYFTKKVYPDYLILILRKGKYYSFGRDRKILDVIKFNNKLSVLNKKKINYLVLDDLEILGIKNFNNNNLRKYFYITYLNDILNEIKVTISP